MVLIAAFAVFVLISRARYTSSVRDSRYWDKKRFTQQVPLTGVSVSCPTGDSIPSSLSTMLPSTASAASALASALPGAQARASATAMPGAAGPAAGPTAATSG